jgi:hypothetical protein
MYLVYVIIVVLLFMLGAASRGIIEDDDIQNDGDRNETFDYAYYEEMYGDTPTPPRTFWQNQRGRDPFPFLDKKERSSMKIRGDRKGHTPRGKTLGDKRRA